MSFDELSEDRRKVLDDIRKRAEEAELARIEAQEILLSVHLSDAAAKYHEADSPKVSLASEADQLREQYFSALSDKDFDHALKLQQELHALDPADEHRDEIIGAFTAAERAATEEAAVNERRTAELLRTANTNYQNEKYDLALENLRELLSFNAENVEAQELTTSIKKAKDLSFRLAEERRREHERVVEPPIIVLPIKKEIPIVFQESAGPKISVAAPVVKDSPAASPLLSRKKQRNIVLRWISYATVAILGLASAIAAFRVAQEKFFLPTKRVLVVAPKLSPSDQYISAGLTGEIISRLSHIPSVQPFSLPTAFALGEMNSSKASQAVRSDYVLHWMIDRVDAGFVVWASLVNTSDSKTIAEERFNVSSSSLSNLSYDIVRPLAEAMNVPGRMLDLAEPQFSANEAAYDAYLRGRSFLRGGDRSALDSAAIFFRRASSLDPAFPPAEAALGWTNILQSELSNDSGHVGEANEHLQRAITLGAKNSEVYRLWGAIEYDRLNNARAIDRLEQAVGIAPADAEAQYWLSRACLRAGKRSEATEAASKAVAAAPLEGKMLRHRAMLLMLDKDFEAALSEFETDLHLSNEATRVYADQFLATLVAVNQHERAIDILTERHKMFPQDFIISYDLGRMLQLAGKSKSNWGAVLEGALALINDTLKSTPNRALAYSYKALVQTRLGNFAEGVISNQKALELTPTDPGILYNSARVYALQKPNSDEAITHLRKAIEHRFDLGQILDLDLRGVLTDQRIAKIAGI